MTVKNDKGTVLRFTITDNEQPFDLSGRDVMVTFVNGGYRSERPASVVDADNGVCEVLITAEDTAKDGILYYQAHVTTDSGKRFSAPIDFITVRSEL